MEVRVVAVQETSLVVTGVVTVTKDTIVAQGIKGTIAVQRTKGTRVVQRVKVTRVTKVRTKGIRIRVDKKVRVAMAPKSKTVTGNDGVGKNSCWSSQGHGMGNHLCPYLKLIMHLLSLLFTALLHIPLPFPLLPYLFRVQLTLTLQTCLL
jgi:hypothetical protein